MCTNCKRRNASCGYLARRPCQQQPIQKLKTSAPPESLKTTPRPRSVAREDASQALQPSELLPTGPHTSQPLFEPGKADRAPAFTENFTLGLHAFSTTIANLTHTSTITAQSPNTLPYLLSHYSTAAYTTLSTLTGQKILHEKIPGLVVRHRFLLHAVLAYAASHVDFLHTSNSTRSYSQMTTTAAYHGQRALQLYRDKIAWYRHHSRQGYATLEGGPECGDQWQRLLNIKQMAEEGYAEDVDHRQREDMDALVGTCLMLTSLFYHNGFASLDGGLDGKSWTQNAISSLPSANSSSPWTQEFGSTPTPYSDLSTTAFCSSNWLATTTGMVTILALPSLQHNLASSIWLPFFQEIDTKHRDHRNNGRIIPSLSTAVGAFFNDPNSCDPHTNTSAAQTVMDERWLEAGIVPSIISNKRSCQISSRFDCAVLNGHIRLDGSTPLRAQLSRLTHLVKLQHHRLTALLPHLDHLLTLDPNEGANFSALISFPCLLPSPLFTNLLSQRDPVALLILGYWFGLLQHGPHWWCTERGRFEGVCVKDVLTGLYGDLDQHSFGAESSDDLIWADALLSRDAVTEFLMWRQMSGLESGRLGST